MAVSLQCEWTIRCGVGFSHVSLLFSRVETEEDYDEVAVFEGEQASDALELSRLSGHNIPPTTVETSGRTVLIQFTSDEDVAGVPLTRPLLAQPHPLRFSFGAPSPSPLAPAAASLYAHVF